MLCIRAFTCDRSGLSHFPMLIQVISLLTEESWHTRIILPTITYNIPTDSVLKEQLSHVPSNDSSVEKNKNKNKLKIASRGITTSTYGEAKCNYGAKNFFLTAPTLMASEKLAIPPSPSPKQIAIYKHWQAARAFGGFAPQACSMNPAHLVSWLDPCLHSPHLQAEPDPRIAVYGGEPLQGTIYPWWWMSDLFPSSVLRSIFSESGSQRSFIVSWHTEPLSIR